MMETEYGLPFEVVEEINPSWDEYNKSVAAAQLLNFERIYIDVTYKRPIDNEYELEDIHEIYETQYVKNDFYELTDDMISKIIEGLQKDDELCDEYYIEQNLWRLPIGLLMLGITSIDDEDDKNELRKSIAAVQKESREKSNWLINKALDDSNYVIDLALKHYGGDVFKNGTWTDYPELQQEITEYSSSH